MNDAALKCCQACGRFNESEIVQKTRAHLIPTPAVVCLSSNNTVLTQRPSPWTTVTCATRYKLFAKRIHPVRAQWFLSHSSPNHVRQWNACKRIPNTRLKRFSSTRQNVPFWRSTFYWKSLYKGNFILSIWGLANCSFTLRATTGLLTPPFRTNRSVLSYRK